MKAREHYTAWKDALNSSNVELCIAAISACLTNIFHEAADVMRQRKAKNVDGLRNEIRDKWRAFCKLLPAQYQIPLIQDLAVDEWRRMYQECRESRSAELFRAEYLLTF